MRLTFQLNKVPILLENCTIFIQFQFKFWSQKYICKKRKRRRCKLSRVLGFVWLIETTRTVGVRYEVWGELDRHAECWADNNTERGTTLWCDQTLININLHQHSYPTIPCPTSTLQHEYSLMYTFSVKVLNVKSVVELL